MSLAKIASLANLPLAGAAAALFVLASVPAALAGPAGVANADTLRLAAPIAQAHAAGGGHSHRHCHHHGHRNYCHQHHHHPRHH